MSSQSAKLLNLYVAPVFITENVFIYERKLYHQAGGGAIESVFTIISANIFGWEWEQTLVH